jgi:hypothetical protein
MHHFVRRVHAVPVETVFAVETIIPAAFIGDPGPDQPVSQFLVADSSSLLAAANDSEPESERDRLPKMFQLFMRLQPIGFLRLEPSRDPFNRE